MAIRISSSDILSSEQLKNHIRVFAGPGAGKTHFLVEKLAIHPQYAEAKNMTLLKKYALRKFCTSCAEKNRYFKKMKLFALKMQSTKNAEAKNMILKKKLA